MIQNKNNDRARCRAAESIAQGLVKSLERHGLYMSLDDAYDVVYGNEDEIAHPPNGPRPYLTKKRRSEKADEQDERFRQRARAYLLDCIGRTDGVNYGPILRPVTSLPKKRQRGRPRKFNMFPEPQRRPRERP